MKNLFSKSLKQKKWAVILASFVVLLFSAGFITYESTKNTVALNLDGQEKVIKTHASNVQELFTELDIKLKNQDYLAPSKDSRISNNLNVVWKPAKQVQLLNEKDEKSIWTTAKTVEDFLVEQNIVLNEHDQVKPKLEANLKDKMDVIVKKAYTITLIDGGKEQKVWSTSTTVADFLKQQEINLTELDRVEPGLEDSVAENDIINVVRVEKVTDVVEEPIGFAVVTKKDENMAKGTEKVLTPGKEGLASREYEITKENGKEISRVLLNEKIIENKQDKVVSVGAKETTVIASRGNESGKEFYVTSTAYTANCSGCSGITATGINLHSNPGAKIIAVDPRVIPLGTKVYVDGYGYAVAADTGGAIKGNKIDVFFASKQDAYQWGRKSVKIKILN